MREHQIIKEGRSLCGKVVIAQDWRVSGCVSSYPWLSKSGHLSCQEFFFLFSEDVTKMPASLEVVPGAFNWLQIKKKDSSVVLILTVIITDRDPRKK